MVCLSSPLIKFIWPFPILHLLNCNFVLHINFHKLVFFYKLSLFSPDSGPCFLYLEGECSIFEGTCKDLYMILKTLEFLVIILNRALIINHTLKDRICIFKFHNSQL